MRVRKVHQENGMRFELLDDEDRPILEARSCSPNTLSAYAHDLLHFYRFLDREGLPCEGFTPRASLRFLEYLRSVPSRRRVQRLSPTIVSTDVEGRPFARLSAATVNRAFATVSSFYEYLIVSGRLATGSENPIKTTEDPERARVPERHKPFVGRASRQKPVREVTRVKTVRRVPRPMSDGQVERFFAGIKRLRDRAAFLLMLQGSLRPGEGVLSGETDAGTALPEVAERIDEMIGG